MLKLPWALYLPSVVPKRLAAVWALILTVSAPSHAVPIVINNGLAPPNPENVIDTADDYSNDDVYVRNVGCPAAGDNVSDPCPQPWGNATHVELAEGGMVGGFPSGDLVVYDSSTITMSGGGVGSEVYAYDSSNIRISGGSVGLHIFASDSSNVRISGGSVNGALYATESSIITIAGYDFEVDGSPVPYGELTGLFGTLTGTLASGDSLDTLFYQGGGSYTGAIRLVREPSTALLLGFGLVGLAAGRRRAWIATH